MAQHISRKELKHDEFREKLSQGAAAVVSHQQQVWLYGAVLLAVLLGVFGYRYYMQRQSAKASVDLADAMRIYDARIRAPNEPAQPGELTYVDEKNKFSDAAQKFSQVAGRYPRTQPGRVARYYDALSLRAARALRGLRKGFQGAGIFRRRGLRGPGGFPARANLRQNRQRSAGRAGIPAPCR